MFKEISNLLARGRSGPQPRELWFKGAARELMAALGRAGRNGVRPSYAVVLHIEKIWNPTPGHEGKAWRWVLDPTPFCLRAPTTCSQEVKMT